MFVSSYIFHFPLSGKEEESDVDYGSTSVEQTPGVSFPFEPLYLNKGKSPTPTHCEELG